jgi:hypothetical protein
VADLRSWYDEKAPIYTLLAQRTEKLIKEILHKEAPFPLLHYLLNDYDLSNFYRLNLNVDTSSSKIGTYND